MMTVSLGVMNLILAIVVEKAAEARENDQERKIELADQERQKDMIQLAILCDRMDKDGSGSLSLQEILDGYDSDESIKSVMKRMDIDRDDMQTIFRGLDSDGCGEVDYVEFCYQLGSCKKRDPLMISSLTRYAVMEVRTLLQGELMKAVKEQTEMIRDQFDLLSQLPGCEKTAMEVKQRALDRREKKPRASAQPESREFIRTSLQRIRSESIREDREEKFWLWSPSTEVTESITSSLMQNQLEILLWKAQELERELRKANENPAGDKPTVDESTEFSCVEESTTTSSTWVQFDARFDDLVKKLHHRTQREEALQVRLQEVLEAISLMLKSPPAVESSGLL